MPYKILLVLTPKFDPNSGGVQMSTYKMGAYFASKGHAVHIFSFGNNGHIAQDFASLHHALEPNAQNNPKNLDRLKNITQKLAPDVVINQMPYKHAISNALLSAKETNRFLLLGCLRNTLFSVVRNLDSYRESVLPPILRPFFANSFGKNLLLQKHKSNHRADLKRILDHYDYFVMFGPPNRQELEYFVGDYKKDKTAFIPNSIPEVVETVPSKEKTLLYLSRVGIGQKRADLILPFWKKVMHALPDWKMEIVGGGPYLENIKAQIGKENIPRISVLGKQKPNEYYRKAPIYIMTSAFEGFPNTLIEAQSFGAVPIIFDNYPIASWVVKDKQNGFLIKPFKVDKMAERAIELARNEAKRQKMAEAALENAGRFVIDKVGETWLDFFNEKLQLKNPQSTS